MCYLLSPASAPWKPFGLGSCKAREKCQNVHMCALCIYCVFIFITWLWPRNPVFSMNYRYLKNMSSERNVSYGEKKKTAFASTHMFGLTTHITRVTQPGKHSLSLIILHFMLPLPSSRLSGWLSQHFSFASPRAQQSGGDWFGQFRFQMFGKCSLASRQKHIFLMFCWT